MGGGFIKSHKNPNVAFIKRKHLHWGCYSLVSATLKLLKEAYKQKFDYYHLISGTTLPIKSLGYILNFYKEKQGCEFVSIWDCVEERIKKLTHLQLIPPRSKLRKYKIFRFIAKISAHIYKKPYKRNNIQFKFSSQWFSITNETCKFVLSMKKWIRRNFSFVLCGDEIFLSTILFNFKNFNNTQTGFNCNMHFMDWSNNATGPCIISPKHIKLINESNYLYARKFDDATFEGVYKLIKK